MAKKPADTTAKKEIPKVPARALAEPKANAVCRLIGAASPSHLTRSWPTARSPGSSRPPKSSRRPEQKTEVEEWIWNSELILGSSSRFLGNVLHRSGEDKRRPRGESKKVDRFPGFARPHMRRRAKVASGSGLDDLTGFPLLPDPTRSPTHTTLQSESELHHERRTTTST
jgi:hypothetical protein